jgi:hypothetical protein
MHDLAMLGMGESCMLLKLLKCFVLECKDVMHWMFKSGLCKQKIVRTQEP